MFFKFQKIPETSAEEFRFIEAFHLLLKLYLPMVYKIAFANKFQMNHEIK